ncbi:DNA repair protein RecO [Candidatus Laterigemmans baculatus]|uniref:DNA repair protein RecO n=1 Tax=Candidatus Laterigemmans baculatus TaxID=2770505 RepID=UPI0013DB0427|nr:DNA repair protein RecO [Candidatus Laterigemmans baculatus]
MASEKTDALVLRTIEFSETSLVVVLLTRQFGKSSALAKGARRAKGPFEGALDLLSICRVVIIPKSGDTLDLLTEAKLQRRFRAGERNLGRLYAGYYVAELLREMTDRGDPHPDLYDLALETLEELDGETDVRACLLRFELQTLRLLGHAPTIDRCAACGSEVPEGGRFGFGVTSGGVLCAACRPATRQVVLLRGATRETLRSLLSEAAVSGPPPPVPAELHGELRGVINRYITNLLGGPPRMQSYLAAASPTIDGQGRRR